MYQRSYVFFLIIVISSLLLEYECFRRLPKYNRLLRSSSIHRDVHELIRSTTLLFAQAPIQNTAGSDALGFSSSLSTTKGFRLDTQIIFGSNAIEHGVNLIEERTQNVLLLSGWNNARLDPILWELEPRGFKFEVCSISEEPTCKNIHDVIAAASRCNCGAIIAMGCGSVMDTAKLATMLINSHEHIGSLAAMSPTDLETYLISSNGKESQRAILDKVLLVTVPALPSLGAELSDVVALRMITEMPNEVKNKEETSEQEHFSESSVPLLYMVEDEMVTVQIPQTSHPTQHGNREIRKVYIQSVHPDLSLVQPSLTYRAPMELVHDRLIALIATSIDIILSDPGFMPEMLAWDALRELVLLLDKAIVSAEDRFTQWTSDPDSFEKQTVHDDERDHRSQEFRRYGHGLEMSTIEDLCRAGISIATARSNMAVGGLQYLSDSLGQMAGRKEGCIMRIGKLFPYYLLALQQWCGDIDSEVSMKSNIIGNKDTSRAMKDGRERVDKDHPYKSFIRTKLDRISEIFQASKFISYQKEDKQSNDDMELEMENIVIGETCGQIMPTAASAAQIFDLNSSGILLIKQMNKLQHYSRLLAGPLNDEEEKDINPNNGDSLTLLRRELFDKTDAKKNLTKKEKRSFDPSEFEKEEKENFVISDYISDKETVFSWSTPKRGSRLSRRALPAVAVSDLDCYNIKMDMKKVCGDCPITHLTVEVLKNILCAGNSFEAAADPVVGVNADYPFSDEDSNRNTNTCSNSNSNSSGSGKGGNSFKANGYPSEGEELTMDRHLQSITSNPRESSVSSAETGSGSSRGAISDPHEDLYNTAKEKMISLTKSAHTAQTDTPVFLDIRENSILSSSHVSAVIDNRNVHSAESSAEAAVKNVPEDPAAAHRRRVKKLLAELNSIDSIRDEDRVGGVKGFRGDNSNSSSSSNVDISNSNSSSNIREPTLVEQQTDILARLLEQRIHDRWAKAAAESPVQSPFKSRE